MHSMRLEPTESILVGTQTIHQDARDAYYGFYMASCRMYLPYTRKTKAEAAEFKECVCLYEYLENN